MTVILDNRVAALLDRVTACFRRERIAYVLIGAWALAAWGRPRATTDVDFLVLVNEGDLERLSGRLVHVGMERDETWEEWNPMLRGLQMRFQSLGVTVDLLRSRDLHDAQVFQRRRKKRMDGRYYWVVSAEDFILQKLKVGRPRDFEDAMSVVQGARVQLDRKYLEYWAGRLGVREELAYIFVSEGNG
ncbi:MAG: hypothetical protein ACRERD_04000 [Candidatus Binatia bacterium]